MLFYLQYLRLYLAFLLYSLLYTHIEQINLLLDCFLYREDLVILVITLQDAINAHNNLFEVTEGFYFLPVLLAYLPLA